MTPQFGPSWILCLVEVLNSWLCMGNEIRFRTHRTRSIFVNPNSSNASNVEYYVFIFWAPGYDFTTLAKSLGFLMNVGAFNFKTCLVKAFAGWTILNLIAVNYNLHEGSDHVNNVGIVKTYHLLSYYWSHFQCIISARLQEGIFIFIEILVFTKCLKYHIPH